MLNWYTLSPDDRIMSVGGNWDEFARENGGDSLVSDKIVGKSIWNYIHDDEIGMMFRSILFTCRTSGETLTLKCDCSLNGHERLMRMNVKKSDADNVLVEHEMIDSSVPMEFVIK